MLAQGASSSLRDSVRQAVDGPYRAAVARAAVDGPCSWTMSALGHAAGRGAGRSVACKRPMQGAVMAHVPSTAQLVGWKRQNTCDAHREASLQARRKFQRVETAQRVVLDPRLHLVIEQRQSTGEAVDALGQMADWCMQPARRDVLACVASSAAAVFSKEALGSRQTVLCDTPPCVVSSAAAGFSKVALDVQQRGAGVDGFRRVLGGPVLNCLGDDFVGETPGNLRSVLGTCPTNDVPCGSPSRQATFGGADAVSACIASPHAAQFGFDEIEFNVPWQSNVGEGSSESTCMTEEVNSFTAQRHARLASEPSDRELRLLWQSPVCADTVQQMLMQERRELVSILSELGGSQPLDGALSVQWNVPVPGLDVQEGFGESSGA